MSKSTRGASNRALKRPTAAVTEYRRPLFPVSRMLVPEGATPVVAGCGTWGWVRLVRGGVTQHHRNLIDVIRAVSEHRLVDAAGQEHLIFDTAKVRALLNKNVNWRDLREGLLDMLATVIQLDGECGEWGAAFPLASFVGDAQSPAARAPHQFPAHLKRLVLSVGFSKLVEDHASVTLSRSVLARVLALEHNVSRAVARWCLSHSGEQHHDLARVLTAVGAIQHGERIAGRAAPRQNRRFISQLRQDAVGLAGLGIEIDGGRLHYRRQKGVFIAAPVGVDAKTPVVDAKTPVVDAKTPVP